MYWVSVSKITNHGSDASTTSQLLATVSPEVAVISVGANNPFGHPSSEVTERLIDKLGEDNVYRTDVDSTIEFITDGERLWIIADSQDIYLPARRLQCKALGAVGSFAELDLALF